MNHPDPSPVSDRRCSAALRWTWLQVLLLLLLLPLLLVSVSVELFMKLGGLALMAVYLVIVLHKVLAVVAGLLGQGGIRVTAEELAAQDPTALPRYTILVPLYREAGIVGDLVVALGAIDYPRDRLEVLLLLEDDDAETRAAMDARVLPAWMRQVVVPPGEPRTKARACNLALAEAQGEYLVIFDAEDRPEPDQLRKAVAAFARSSPRIWCLQAKLNVYNAFENRWTRWFTLEYSTWFDLYLPGLHALHSPIPLGGTSNHFRTGALHQLGGWDAFNVTEDCDLGLRVARAGGRTAILDSTTWEEAPTRFLPWLRQRSRWIKGYWQTLLVHTRRPLTGLREFGPLGYVQMLLTVAGPVVSLLLNPLCWAVLGLWCWLQWPLVDSSRPWTTGLLVSAALLLLFNPFLVVVHAIGGYRRGQRRLLLDAALLPLYWPLLSLGAWRGVLQFLVAPSRWEKTPHGVMQQESPDWVAADTRRPRRRWAVAILLLTTVILTGGGYWLIRSTGVDAYLRQRLVVVRGPRTLLSGDSRQTERGIDAGWLGRTRLDLVVKLQGPAAPGERTLRGIVFLKVDDGQYYQHETEDLICRDGAVALALPLTGGWQPVDCERPWGPWCLRRVRAVGVRLYGEVAPSTGVEIATCEPAGQTPALALQAWVGPAPETAPAGTVVEVGFELDRVYDNPFDPDQVRIDGVITPPDGSRRVVPAFYRQDYRRELHDGKEVLIAVGEPGWALRFLPDAPGTWSWHLEGVDHHTDRLRTEARHLTVTAAPHRGFVRVARDRRHFAFADGSFCYPIAINYRSPHDIRNREKWDFALPDPDRGTYVIDDYLARMRAGGITLVRQWMCPWWLSLEWRRDWPGFHGMGRYSLQNAWRLDHVLQRAAELDLLVELTLDYQGPWIERYDTQWPDNPLNPVNGGDLADPSQVLVRADMKRLFRQRYRYLAARWGAYPNLFAWTLWNEVNEIDWDDDVQAAWHREMARAMHEVDNGRHLVSTEFIGEYGVGEVWELPEIDFTQVSAYNRGTGLVETFRRQNTRLGRHDKPRVLEEYGAHAGGCSMAAIAQELHDGLWTGWLQPQAGTAMLWWWNLVVEKDLFFNYQTFADFIAGEDLRDRDWRYDRLDLPDTSLAALTRCADDRAYAWVFSPQHSEILYERGEWSEQSAKLDGAYAARKHPDFDPLSAKPTRRFEPVRGAILCLPGGTLRSGRYTVELWDTWSGTHTASTEELKAGEAQLRIPLPTMERDLAVKIRRELR